MVVWYELWFMILMFSDLGFLGGFGCDIIFFVRWIDCLIWVSVYDYVSDLVPFWGFWFCFDFIWFLFVLSDCLKENILPPFIRTQWKSTRMWDILGMGASERYGSWKAKRPQNSLPWNAFSVVKRYILFFPVHKCIFF